MSHRRYFLWPKRFLKLMWNLKKEFIDFNHTKFPDEKSASRTLDALIKKIELSWTDHSNHPPIILNNMKSSSYVLLQSYRSFEKWSKKTKAIMPRFPILNVILQPKVQWLQEKHHGFSNFDYTRKWVLWVPEGTCLY